MPAPKKNGQAFSEEQWTQFGEDYLAAVVKGYLVAGDPGYQTCDPSQRLNIHLALKWDITESAFRNRVRQIKQRPIWNEKIVPAFNARTFDSVQEPDVPDVDTQIRERRLEQQLRDAKQREKELLDRIIQLEDVRGEIFDLVDRIEGPRIIHPDPREKTGGKRSVILHVSDIHGGEHVDLYEMDGLNSYDGPICLARIQRLFRRTASLLTEHWSGDPVEKIVIVLGGDMVDNNLREESRRGGAMPVVEAMKMVSEGVAGGIVYLVEALKEYFGIEIEIEIYTTPGNHGRLTIKPHITEGNIDNLDVMVSFTIEKILAHLNNVRFIYTGSGEALFNLYGWLFLARHGHEGSGGTGGMYGPAYKQVRGMYRAHWSYARRGRAFNWVLQGHDHTASQLPFGIANGSIVGYNPYAMRKLLADPSPASQNLITVEQKHGLIGRQEIFLGVPEEGTLYEVPEVSDDLLKDLRGDYS